MKNDKIHPRKLKPAPKKVLRVRFYKFSIFGVWKITKKHKFSIFGKLKTFFFERWHPLLTIFPYPDWIKEWLGQKSWKKERFPPELQFFYCFGALGISLTKWQIMAILRLSWRGSTNNKKYTVNGTISTPLSTLYNKRPWGAPNFHFIFVGNFFILFFFTKKNKVEKKGHRLFLDTAYF